MEGAIQLEKHIFSPLRIRSLASKMRQPAVSLVNRVVSLSTKTKIFQPSARRTRDIVPPLGITIGAIAFGFWWSSFAAGLFAGIALFFLAGIYAATRQTVAAVPTREAGGMAETRVNWDTSAMADQSHRNIETLAAIQNLQLWVANETSPTEENVKASCAVLLQSIVPRNNK